MNKALALYQNYCNYSITDNVQLLDYKVDIDVLRNELFSFISNNRFGFDAVSLRLPPGETNYVSSNESLTATATSAYDYLSTEKQMPLNTAPNSDYTEWHPDLKDSYVSTIVPELEQLCGFKIGRIRLGWLMPGSGYPIHQDLEPLRLHIPLITNSNSYIIHEHNLYHMEYGKLYHLITTGIHTAWNFGKLPRLHLVFSTYSIPEVEQAITDLANLDHLHTNFSQHINGLDQTSLAFLYKVFNQSSTNKEQLLHEIKSIAKLIT